MLFPSSSLVPSTETRDSFIAPSSDGTALTERHETRERDLSWRHADVEQLWPSLWYSIKAGAVRLYAFGCSVKYLFLTILSLQWAVQNCNRGEQTRSKKSSLFANCQHKNLCQWARRWTSLFCVKWVATSDTSKSSKHQARKN
jgi:hypothetical protein